MASTTEPSVIEQNKQLVRNYVEDVFNRHDLAAVDKYTKGAEDVKRYLGEYFAGHPDSHTMIDQILAEDDKLNSFHYRRILFLKRYHSTARWARYDITPKI